LVKIKVMNRREIILEKIPDQDFLFADGFDDAIIGLCEKTDVVIYSTKKIIEILTNAGMEYRDALEHFHFNILDGSLGDLTPIFCDDIIF
jgi:hypothetical protein